MWMKKEMCMEITMLALLKENSPIAHMVLSLAGKKNIFLEVIFISVSYVRQPAISCQPATAEKYEWLLN